MSRGSVTMYGGPSEPGPGPWPDPVPGCPTTPFAPVMPQLAPFAVGTLLKMVAQPRPDVVAGLVQLLPRLKDALMKTNSAPLTPDEVTALVWLEGVAAGAQK